MLLRALARAKLNYLMWRSWNQKINGVVAAPTAGTFSAELVNAAGVSLAHINTMNIVRSGSTPITFSLLTPLTGAYSIAVKYMGREVPFGPENVVYSGPSADPCPQIMAVIKGFYDYAVQERSKWLEILGKESEALKEVVKEVDRARAAGSIGEEMNALVNRAMTQLRMIDNYIEDLFSYTLY